MGPTYTEGMRDWSKLDAQGLSQLPDDFVAIVAHPSVSRFRI